MLWFKPKKARASAAPSVPEGEVVYAVGDVHGRADLLAKLLSKLKTDMAASPNLRSRLIMLGDYIDRGSASRKVIDLLLRQRKSDGERLTLLKGNHESALLDFLDDPMTGPAWCDHGGRDTLLSYGVMAPRGRSLEEWTAARDALAAAMPKSHREFLANLTTHAVIGDYAFVHAGFRPRKPLSEQIEDDMLWIRGDFLQAPPWISQVIVHGHTPFPEPSETRTRIGIDTGAYATGVLTALRLEGDQRRYIQTVS